MEVVRDLVLGEATLISVVNTARYFSCLNKLNRVH